MIKEDLTKLNSMNINELKKLFLRYFNAHPTLKTKESSSNGKPSVTFFKERQYSRTSSTFISVQSFTGWRLEARRVKGILDMLDPITPLAPHQ